MKFARGDTKSTMNMKQFIDELRKGEHELYPYQRQMIEEVEKCLTKTSPQKLYNLAYHDSLTGLYNRNKLEEGETTAPFSSQ